MISYGKQSIDQSDIDCVLEVLKSDWLTQGPAVELFESHLKTYFGSNHACVVSNGTAALHLVGLALGWQKDDIIITTPITFLSTANCILFSGSQPDFADIDHCSYTINPNLVEEKIKYHMSRGKQVKAVIGVDYAGHPCDWKSLRILADEYGFKLINDNCHALGASYFGNIKYAAKYADIVTQSFHPVKNITTGEGGAILTNDFEIDKKVKSLRTHGINKNVKEYSKNEGPWYYEMVELGYNYRITDFQCALGINQLKKLNHFIDKRREIAFKYDESFSDNDNLTIPKSDNNIKHAYHIYPLKINFSSINVSKQDFFNKLLSLGIRLQVHYIPVHLQPYYQTNYNFKSGDFPVAENFYKKEVSLPIFYNLTNDQLSFVIDAIKRNIK
tara:strand:+ start:373 stop:1533 length:1161 start_codon:yes stop_codon:yes gene_type:complete